MLGGNVLAITGIYQLILRDILLNNFLTLNQQLQDLITPFSLIIKELYYISRQKL